MRPWIDTVSFRKQPNQNNWWFYVNGTYAGVYRQVWRKKQPTYDILWNFAALAELGIVTTLFPKTADDLYLPNLYCLKQRPDSWLISGALIYDNFLETNEFI